MTKPDMEPDPGSNEEQLTLENWNDFVIDDLDANSDQQIWNRFILLKQAEINTMAQLLPQRQKRRVDTLTSATSKGPDPLPDS